MDLRRLLRINKRLALGRVCFLLAALVLVWPIHFRAANGASFSSSTGRIGLTSFDHQTCPWELQLGHVRNAAPVPPRDSGDLIDSYNNSACTAKRYDRTSEALLWVIIGSALTVSAWRRRGRQAGAARFEMSSETVFST